MTAAELPKSFPSFPNSPVSTPTVDPESVVIDQSPPSLLLVHDPNRARGRVLSTRFRRTRPRFGSIGSRPVRRRDRLRGNLLGSAGRGQAPPEPSTSPPTAPHRSSSTPPTHPDSGGTPTPRSPRRPPRR